VIVSFQGKSINEKPKFHAVTVSGEFTGSHVRSVLRYDTIVEINVDSKAEYTA